MVHSYTDSSYNYKRASQTFFTIPFFYSDLSFGLLPLLLLLGWIGCLLMSYLVYRLIRLQQRQLLALKQARRQFLTALLQALQPVLDDIFLPMLRSWLRESPPPSAEWRQLKQGTDHLLLLTDQLTSLRRIETHRPPVQYVQEDVLSFLPSVLELLAARAEERHVRLQLDTTSTEIITYFDKGKLLTILSSLLWYQLKRTPPGGMIVLHVDRQGLAGDSPTNFGLGSSPPTPCLLLRIQSIRQAEERAIRSFTTPRSRSSMPLPDLGITLCRRLVALLDGQLYLSEQSGQDAMLTICLPIRSMELTTLAEHDPHQANTLSRLRSLLYPSPGWQRRHRTTISNPMTDAVMPTLPTQARILVIATPAVAADKFARKLPYWCRPLIASDGQNALLQALTEVHDLVICIPNLPKLDGLGICKVLKNDERTSHLPVLYITDAATSDERLSGLEAGADACLCQPVRERELSLQIRQLLHTRRQLRLYYRRLGGNEDYSLANSAWNPVQQSRLEQQFLQKLQQTVERNLLNYQFSVPELCREIGMSHPQLHRKLVALTGQSTIKFIRSVRLAKAKTLLRQSDRSVRDVAFATGFRDPAFFSRSFNQQFGLSPSAYRRSRADADCGKKNPSF